MSFILIFKTYIKTKSLVSVRIVMLYTYFFLIFNYLDLTLPNGIEPSKPGFMMKLEYFLIIMSALLFTGIFWLINKSFPRYFMPWLFLTVVERRRKKVFL